LLERFYRTNYQGLQTLSKAGKITAQDLITAFGASNEELERRFRELPLTWNVAMTRIRNSLVNFAMQVVRASQGFSILAQVVMFAFTRIEWAVRRAIDFFGGLTNVVEVFQYALLVALAAGTAALIPFAAATLAALWPWLAIGAAIIAAGVALQDLVYWIQGKGSAIGALVGPFEDIQKQLKETFGFGEGGIFSGLKLPEGTTKDWFTYLGLPTSDVIEATKRELKGISDAFEAIDAILRRWGTGFPRFEDTFREFMFFYNWVKNTNWDEVFTLENFKKTAIQMWEEFKKPFIDAMAWIRDQFNIKIEWPGLQYIIDKATGWINDLRTLISKIPGLGGLAPAGAPQEPATATFGSDAISAAFAKGQVPGQTTPGAQDTGGILQTMKDFFINEPMKALGVGMPWDKTGVGPTTTNNNVAPILQQTNNIAVTTSPDEAALAQMVADRVSAQSPSLLDQVSRQIQDAIPRTEAATA